MAVEDSNTKCCTKCGENKPLTAFSKDADKRDGLNTRCKLCRSVEHAIWRAKNPEAVKNNYAAWYAKNADRARAYSREYAKKHPEQVKATIADWCARNKARKLASMRDWSDRNKEYRKKKNREYLESNRDKKKIWHQNRRARQKTGKISSGRVKQLLLLQKKKCACGCGLPLGDDYHLDHIMPLALGGTNTDHNIQLLRAECNLKKHSKHPVDFMQQRGFLI